MTTKIEKESPYEWDTNILDLQKENTEVLCKLIDYIKINNLNVLFIIPPRPFEKKTMQRLNCASNIIKENNFEIINFNTLSDFKLNLDKDFFNTYHLNVYGATKFTLYFGKYLQEKYQFKCIDIPNWEDEYIRFKNDYLQITKNDFEDLLLEYNK